MAPTNEKTPRELCDEIMSLRDANYSLSLDIWKLEEQANDYRYSLATGSENKRYTSQYIKRLREIEGEITETEGFIRQNEERIREITRQLGIH